MTAIERFGPGVVGFLLVGLLAKVSLRKYIAPQGTTARYDLSILDLLKHACVVAICVVVAERTLNASLFAIGFIAVLCIGIGILQHRFRTNAAYIWQWDELPPTRNERLWMLDGFFVFFLAELPITA